VSLDGIGASRGTFEREGADPLPLEVATDRADAVYAVGEQITFHIERSAVGSLPEALSYEITRGGASLVRSGSIPAAALPASVRMMAREPGFFYLEIEPGPSLDASNRRRAAVAVAPERISPSLPPPDDFAGFWQDELRRQQAAPIRAELKPRTVRDEATIHSVRIGTPEAGDVHGWLLVPREHAGTGAGFPALIRYHGAGVYGLAPDDGLDWAARGVMVFSVNPHSIPNDWPEERYAALRDGALADYRTRGRSDRRSVYFHEMFLRASRAVDFVTTLGQWDGRHLVVEGHSQGGGLAMAAAALNRGVTALAVSCPALCDHGGPVIGRAAGWPRLVEFQNSVPDRAQLEAARYFDGVNFAPLINVPAFFSIAFLDDVCPPEGIYAAYNRLRGPRWVHHDIGSSHVYTDAAKEAVRQWIGDAIR
jgi:cephalosporin-C deacetylase